MQVTSSRNRRRRSSSSPTLNTTTCSVQCVELIWREKLHESIADEPMHGHHALSTLISHSRPTFISIVFPLALAPVSADSIHDVLSRRAMVIFPRQRTCDTPSSCPATTNACMRLHLSELQTGHLDERHLAPSSLPPCMLAQIFSSCAPTHDSALVLLLVRPVYLHNTGPAHTD